MPQGSIIGPLRFCIFINDLPPHIRDKKVGNSVFADDLSHDIRGKTLKEIGVRLQKSITEVSNWCEKNRMCLQTKCMATTTRQKHQRSPLCLTREVNSETVTQVKDHRVLGLTIDDELKWQAHVGNVCKTVSKNVVLMSQLKRYVNSQTLRMFFNSHIMPHIHFSSTVRWLQ